MFADLPAVLASASSLAAMTPSTFTPSTPPLPIDHSVNLEQLSMPQLVERFIRYPPYSNRMFDIENSLVSAHQRIRDQLSQLGSEVDLPSPPSPYLPSPHYLSPPQVASPSENNPSITIEHVSPNSRPATSSALAEYLRDNLYD